MPYCLKCGKRLPDDAEFCNSCGTPVLKEEKKPDEMKDHTPPPDPSATLHKGKVLYGAVIVEKLPSGYVIDNRYEVIRKLGQ
ncbi:MAG TPA: zinc ribbon domain-containing protein, partial [Bacteroidales bacterium]|nr:zinc ribbon domain-containing protein [Bacteroidales bacterium]